VDEYAQRSVETAVSEHGVMTVRFNRPARHNAWSLALENEYFAALDAAAADERVRAVVVTGNGTSFCPGVDVEQLRDEAARGEIDLDGRRPMFTPRLCPKPMIAAINGACAGIGLLHACFCDVRFVNAQAKISTAFARRGLCAEYGMAWLLPRLIGVERAADLLLSGRTITGEEMVSIGLASRACPVDEVVAEAEAYAAMLAEWSSPRSMAAMREQIWGGLDQGFTEAWDASVAESVRFVTFPDFAEGVASFRERRPPRFPPWRPVT
jgi:enoyl-CoA hydratase/carnithine racemase